MENLRELLANHSFLKKIHTVWILLPDTHKEKQGLAPPTLLTVHSGMSLFPLESKHTAVPLF